MKKCFQFIILVYIMMVYTFSIPLYASEPTPDWGLSLGELLNLKVITASKKSESMSESPGVISVITERDIKAYGANSLWDVLNMLPSLQPLKNVIY